MKNRLAFVTAALVISVTGLIASAEAEETFPRGLTQEFSWCGAGPDGGCSRFEGYIYVKRSPGAASTGERFSAPADPAFGGQRLYVHAGEAEPR